MSSSYFVQAQSVIDTYNQEYSSQVEKRLKHEVFSKFSDIMIPGHMYKTILLKHELTDLASLYGVNYFDPSARIISYRLHYTDITDSVGLEERTLEVGS